SVFFTSSATTYIYTLSLHDALPISLQVFHPDFFGGTWTFYPDPVDFARYQLVDIYNDNNAFVAPGYDPPVNVHELIAGEVHGIRSEEHTSELQSLTNLVCRLLLEKK